MWRKGNKNFISSPTESFPNPFQFLLVSNAVTVFECHRVTNLQNMYRECEFRVQPTQCPDLALCLMMAVCLFGTSVSSSAKWGWSLNFWTGLRPKDPHTGTTNSSLYLCVTLPFWTPLPQSWRFKCCCHRLMSLHTTLCHLFMDPVRDLKGGRTMSQSPYKTATSERGPSTQCSVATCRFSIQNSEFMEPPSSVTSSIRGRHSRDGRGKN